MFVRIYFILITLYFALGIPFLANAFVFQNDLRLGDQSTDVIELQKALNSDPAVAVSVSGPGSPGLETSYFGSLTYQAILKFQYKYKNDVLTPAGLTQATGIVGPNTRAKLTSLSVKTPIKPINTPIQSQIPVQSVQLVPVMPQKPPKLYAYSPFQVVPGGKITLTGANFTTNDNVIHVGDGFTVTATTSDSTTLAFTLPSGLGEGKYTLWVTNTNGSSRNPTFTITLVVTNSPKPAPEVTTISPATIHTLEENITISGSGFTPSNTVYTIFGQLTVSSSDGKTITLNPASLPVAKKLREIMQAKDVGLVLTIPVYVINDNGVSQVKNFSIK